MQHNLSSFVIWDIYDVQMENLIFHGDLNNWLPQISKTSVKQDVSIAIQRWWCYYSLLYRCTLFIDY